MTQKMERFWVAFFGTLILCGAGFGTLLLFIWCMENYGPLVAFPVFFVVIAVFAGIMHSGSEEKSSDGDAQ